MKKIILASLFLIGLSSFGSTYRDGTYRGNFISGQENQVEVQFKLKNDTISNTKFRTLLYKGNDYLKNKELENEKNKYQEALKYTEGKKVADALESLYSPENIPRAGATIRATKIRAAIQNAINSGVYKPE
ncbi:hypothetical protein [Fusobacterium sp. SYSU M8A802]